MLVEAGWNEADDPSYARNVGALSKTIRTRDFKYRRNHRRSEVLYDLRNDPHEFTNVAGRAEYRDTVAEMRSRLFETTLQIEDTLPLKTGPY